MLVSRRSLSRLTCGLTACASAVALTAIASPAYASTSRHHLHGTAPQWLRHARDLGSVPTSSGVTFGVVLGLRNAAAAEAAIKDLSDPASAHYGRWLSRAQF